MSNQVAVQQASGWSDVPLLKEIREATDRIRERAFALFERRGGELGRELEDWLQAERDVLGSATSEMIENGSEYKIRVALPGFDGKDVKVTATPEEVVVQAEQEHKHEVTEGTVHHCEFTSKSVFRRFGMPEKIDEGLVTAKLDKGILEIQAKKAAQAKQIGQAA